MKWLKRKGFGSSMAANAIAFVALAFSIIGAIKQQKIKFRSAKNESV